MAWKVRGGRGGKKRAMGLVGEREREKECDCKREKGGRGEWMTLSVGMEGYFKNVIGRRLLRTPLC